MSRIFHCAAAGADEIEKIITEYTEVTKYMARIAGVDLPREKRVEIGLTYIYGIGLATSKQILAATGINPDTRVKDLDETDVSKLREYIDHNLTVEGELRGQVSLNIKRLMESGIWQVRKERMFRVSAENSKR